MPRPAVAGRERKIAERETRGCFACDSRGSPLAELSRIVVSCVVSRGGLKSGWICVSVVLLSGVDDNDVIGPRDKNLGLGAVRVALVLLGLV